MSRVFTETITRNQITLGPLQNQSWNMFYQGTGAAFDLVVQETTSGSPTGSIYSLIDPVTPGPTGTQGPTGSNGPTGSQGPTGLSNLVGPFATNSLLFYNSEITGSTDLTFSSNNLTINGNVQVSGTGSNLIIRQYGVVGYSTKVTLDRISAEVEPANRLLLTPIGGWSFSGWSQTITSSSTLVQSYPTRSGGISSAPMNNQSDGCITIIGDNLPTNNSYEIKVINVGNSKFSITITRLV